MFNFGITNAVPEEHHWLVDFDCGCQAMCDSVWSHDAGWHLGVYVCVELCHVSCEYSFRVLTL